MNNSRKTTFCCSILFILIITLSQTIPGNTFPRFISANIKPKININGTNSRVNRGVYEIFRQGSGIINSLPINLTRNSFKAWCAGGIIADVDDSFADKLSELNPEIVVSRLNGTLFPIVLNENDVSNKYTNTKKGQLSWNRQISGILYLKKILGLSGRGRKLGVIALDYGISHKCLNGRIKNIMKFASTDAEDSGRDTCRTLDDLYLVHPLGLLVGSDSAKFEGIAPETDIKLALISKTSNNSSELLKAIQWIIESEDENRPDAILFLTDFRRTPPVAVQNALFACRNVGIIPIAPAGNNPNAVGGIAGLPCTITVGAIDRWKKRALFSGSGPSIFNGGKVLKPDFCEPGLAIYGPSDKNKYSFGSGTAQAAVHFAGVFLLIKQLFPNIESEVIVNALKQRTEDLGDLPGPDNKTGFGLPIPDLAIDLIQNPPQQDGQP